MERGFKITCICGHFISKNNDLSKLNYYKLKKPTLNKTDKGEKITEETFFYYVCPKCERDVIVIMRKAVNSFGAIKTLLPEKITGLKAIEYLQLTAENRINKTNELLYSCSNIYSTGIPMSYYKTMSATTQRARYLNESGYSGDKIESKVKIYN